MFLRSLFVLTNVLTITSCATVADLRQKLEAKPSCCKSMSEFTYEQLKKEGAFPFFLNEESPVYSFDTGKSYFKAFALPSDFQVHRLHVSSQPTGSIGFEASKYSQSFCPRALFLDKAFNTISAVDSIPTYSKSFWSSSFVSNFEIPAGARYVVLYTNPHTFTRSAVRYTSGGGYMVGSTFIYNPGGEPINHPCGPVADAVVELQ